MKNLFIFLFLFSFLELVQAQVPAGFSFQTVVRGADGRLKKNSPVNLIFTLSPGQNATPIWQEAQSKVTDAYGVASVVIGEGTTNLVTGPSQFSAIQFGSGEFWISIYLNSATPGNLIYKQKLWSVPYARYAEFSNNTLPTGMIMPFGGKPDKIPAGWALCDGRTINANDSSAKYAALYAVIGNQWGGSGALDFRLPDLRGRFLRGVSNVDSLDPDRSGRFRLSPFGIAGPVVGSYQGDAFQGHWHDYRTGGNLQISISPNLAGSNGNPHGGANGTDILNPSNDGQNGNPRTSKETRPKNAYVYYIIKL